MTIDYAISNYKCDVKVDVGLPCSHVVELPCWEEDLILIGRREWPECTQPSIAPYIYPSCKHQLSCTCKQYREYENGSAPTCKVQCEYVPNCGHVVQLTCHLKNLITQNQVHHTCSKMVQMRLPRCGHGTSVPCTEAEKLRSTWSGISIEESGRVEEGKKYGPKDYVCRKKSILVRKCGHEEQMACENAFDRANTRSECKELVTFTSPECGHCIETTCFLAKKIQEQATAIYYPQELPEVQPFSRLHAKDLEKYANLQDDLKCLKEVEFVRECGHVEKMACHTARSIRTTCKESVDIKSPLCGHMISVPCKDISLVQNWVPWSEDVLNSDSLKLLYECNVVDELLPQPTRNMRVSQPVLTAIKSCKEGVTFRRSNSCNHEFSVSCSKAFEFVEELQSDKKGTITPCKVITNKELPCGHVRSMECCQPMEKVRCDEIVERECWNFAACGQKIAFKCYNAPSRESGVIKCSSKTLWSCESEKHEFKLDICAIGIPQECPHCSIEKCEKELDAVEALVASNQEQNPLPVDLPGRLSEIKDVKIIHMGENDIFDFRQRELTLLERYYGWWKTKFKAKNNLWKGPLYKPQWIPIFMCLATKEAGKNAQLMKRFDHHRLVSLKTLQGIEVYELTRTNLEAAVSSVKHGPITLIFGRALSLLLLDHPSKIPTMKQKGKLITWQEQQMKQGYDAMIRDATLNRVSVEKIALWEPFVVYPTHCVLVTAENAQLLVDSAPVESSIVRKPKISQRVIPSTSENNEVIQVATNSMPTDLLEKVYESLQRTAAKDIVLLFPWTTKTFSETLALPASVEKQLTETLQILPANKVENRPLKKGTTPFTGVNLLKKISRQYESFPELDLLLALELLALQKNDASESEEHLKRYLDQIQKSGTVAHPLLLVALARLALRKKNYDAQLQCNTLLRLFHELYFVMESENDSELRKWLDLSEHAIIFAPDITSGMKATEQGQEASTPAAKWQVMKEENGYQSESMDELMALVGLKKVKQTAIILFKNASALRQLTPEQRKKNVFSFNYCFMGNPGTGKTTVARLFARILQDAGLRTSAGFEEATAQQLKDKGVDEFRNLMQKATSGGNAANQRSGTKNNQGGGVVFIDEAYDLDPMGDFKGKPIVAELLTASENEREKLSLILAGYEQDIHEKLFAFNQGLKSRFEEVLFEDLEEEELLTVWNKLMKDREWTDFEPNCPVGPIAIRRLVKGKGRKGFGNARTVRKMFEKATKDAMSREDFHPMKLKIADVLGEKPTANPKLRTVLDQIDQRIGWKKIKASINELVTLCDQNYEREMKGLKASPVILNRCFLGNPGTGKTTCAEYYGRVLKHLNFLSNGEVVKKTAGDFISGHVGGSQQTAVSILEQAKGKVLMIDEAYNLNDGLYGKQVLDVIVEKVQGSETDDIAVLLLGYEHQMKEMFRTANPGLARRFALDYAFYFEDYEPHELFDLFNLACKRQEVRANLAVSEEIIRQLTLQRKMPNFGNAGAVELLLKSAIQKASARISNQSIDGSVVLALEDVMSEEDKAKRAKDNGVPKDPLSILDSLYRMETIKKNLGRLQKTVQLAQDEGTELPEIGHFVFRGSPGTGKTTVARGMADILYRMNLIATNRLTETSGLNLTGEYLGQTKKKVEDQLGMARGGVLFIDEAYELGKGPYGEEAMTSLVAAMTDPVYEGLVIIIAGYAQDMDAMLNRNAGLKSRFTRFFDFPDWEPCDCVKFFKEKAYKENYHLNESTLDFLESSVFKQLRDFEGFGNGRDVVKFYQEALQSRACRVADHPEMEKQITLEDVEAAGKLILMNRKPPSPRKQNHPSDSNDTCMPVAYDLPQQQMRPQFIEKDETYQKPQFNLEPEVEEQSCIEEIEEEEVIETRTQRDAGVSDEDWDELQKAIEEHEAKLRRLKEQREFEKIKEMERQKQETLKTIRRLMRCPAGYDWHQVGGGWRCSAGGHFVSDQELERNFTC